MAVTTHIVASSPDYRRTATRAPIRYDAILLLKGLYFVGCMRLIFAPHPAAIWVLPIHGSDLGIATEPLNQHWQLQRPKMDGRVASLARQCTQYEVRLAELESSLRSEIERTAFLSADLRNTRDQLNSQVAQIEAAKLKSLPLISERLAHAQDRAVQARTHIPALTHETQVAQASFLDGHEKARRLVSVLSTHTAHWTTKLLRIIRREAPPDRYTIAMATVHAALFLAILAFARWVFTWVGWKILMRYVDAKRPHIHQLLGLDPRT